MKGKKAEAKLARRQKDFDDSNMEKSTYLKYHRPGSKNWHK